MTTSEQINEIAAALSKAQGAMRPATKDAINPAYRSKYADLAAVWDAVRGPLASHGIAAVQDAQLGERGVSVVTRLIHASGQWIEFGPLTVPLAKADAHGVGSATSYAKRYALSAALGIVAEDDDDGNAAVTGDNGKSAARAVAAPKGFGEWFASMTASADAGEAALRAAWKASPDEHRAYVTAHQKDRWEALKARAAKAEADHAA